MIGRHFPLLQCFLWFIIHLMTWRCPWSLLGTKLSSFYSSVYLLSWTSHIMNLDFFFYCICLTQFFQTCLITKYFISALFSMVHDRVAQILKMFLLASPLLTGTTAKHYKRIVSLQPCHNDWHPDESSLWQWRKWWKELVSKQALSM